MKAIVVGATGAVGRDLVSVLLADPRYEEVVTFTRRELGVEDGKLRSYVVDFEKPEGWNDLVRGGCPLLRTRHVEEAGGLESGAASYRL